VNLENLESPKRDKPVSNTPKGGKNGKKKTVKQIMKQDSKRRGLNLKYIKDKYTKKV